MTRDLRELLTPEVLERCGEASDVLYAHDDILWSHAERVLEEFIKVVEESEEQALALRAMAPPPAGRAPDVLA